RNGTAPETVGGTNTAVSSSVNPSTFGQSVTFTATVTAQKGGAAVTAGSVTFFEGASCSGTALAGPTALNASGQASFGTSTLSVASHTIRACYGGSASFATSNGSVNQTVNQASTSTALGSTPNPSTFGQSVTFTATVTSGASPVTTGSVTLIEGGTCATPTTILGAATPVNGSGQATFSVSTLTASGSPHTVVACYGGTTSFSASNGSTSQVVNKANSATTVTSAPNPSTFAQSVTFTATVTGGGNPATAGSVTFIEGGTCAAPGTTLAGPTAVNASGQASFSTTTLTASGSPHTIVACYGGSGDLNASSGSVSQVVNKATPTTAVDSKTSRPSTARR